MRGIVILLVLFATSGPNNAARAEQSNDCKLCRELLQAWENYCDGSSAEVLRLPIRKSKVSAA